MSVQNPGHWSPGGLGTGSPGGFKMFSLWSWRAGPWMCILLVLFTLHVCTWNSYMYNIFHNNFYINGHNHKYINFIYNYVLYMSVTQLCLTLCNPMNCSPPGFSGHGILQSEVLEWVAIPFSRESSLPRDWTQVSHIAWDFFLLYCRFITVYVGIIKHIKRAIFKGWGKGKIKHSFNFLHGPPKHFCYQIVEVWLHVLNI